MIVLACPMCASAVTTAIVFSLQGFGTEYFNSSSNVSGSAEIYECICTMFLYVYLHILPLLAQIKIGSVGLYKNEFNKGINNYGLLNCHWIFWHMFP